MRLIFQSGHRTGISSAETRFSIRFLWGGSRHRTKEISAPTLGLTLKAGKVP
jgi:hypothetical protein